jgi:hypothetical protein
MNFFAATKKVSVKEEKYSFRDLENANDDTGMFSTNFNAQMLLK